MRCSAFILACAICLSSLEAAVRFTEPVWRPDLGVQIPALAEASARPLTLPRAESYLVTDEDGPHLEDRYDSFDLWSFASLRGRWLDASGNQLFLARLDSLPPDDTSGAVRTRRSFRRALAREPFNPKNVQHRNEAAALISPIDLKNPVAPRRAQRRNLTDLVCYPTTNDHAIVYAFRPRSPERRESPPWLLAVLVAAPQEDLAEVRARFDADFIDRITIPSANARRRLAKAAPAPADDATEQELLSADVCASVANFDDWHACVADDVTIIDDLNPAVRGSFISSLTNNLPRLRKAYAERVPSPLVQVFAPAVVRVFRNREEYLAHVGVEYQWTGALWSPTHRELVLYHPERGTEELLRTVWHEAFHQYLAYAGSMIESAPWFNEGHAQLFEHAHFDRKGALVFEREPQAAAYVHEYAAQLAEMLPAILEMDYAEFYAGSSETVAARYRVAWSIAYFLEVGAPKLRFQPYASLRADYLAHLVATRNKRAATQKLFGDEKSRDAFVAAWLAFWRE